MKVASSGLLGMNGLRTNHAKITVKFVIFARLYIDTDKEIERKGDIMRREIIL